MPNWVTTVLKADPKVIDSIVNNDGDVDFEKICKFEGPHRPDMIDFSEESLAISLISKSTSKHLRTLLVDPSSFEKEIKLYALEKGMPKPSGKQALMFIENHLKCGFIHEMEFARNKWGTKWNAYDSDRTDEKTIRFETAWACPKEVLVELSKKFPSELLSVKFADEDIGYNCGQFELKNGSTLSEDCRDSKNVGKEYSKKWIRFAAEIKGWEEPELNDLLDDV